MSVACKVIILFPLLVFLSACTFQAPSGHTLLAVSSGQQQEPFLLLTDWRTARERKTAVTGEGKEDAFYFLIKGENRILALDRTGSWRLIASDGSESARGSLAGEVAAAFDADRERALVQIGLSPFRYLRWDLERNETESVTPTLPPGQKMVGGYLALEGDRMAFLVQNSQGRSQLILFTGTEIQPLVYLPADFHPVSYRQRPPADPSFLSLSPDGRWACLYGEGQPGEGVPLILVDCERGSSNFLIWPLERNALPAHLRWSPNSRRLAISSDLFDGSGSSLVVDLPLKKMEWFDDITFWLDSSWLLLYHSSPPGAEYAPPLAARLYNIENGQNQTLDLSGYSFIWDVMSK